ncbi:UNVERIFIED_CONTAM: Vacuolar protein sorting-associated protein 53 A, partial [Sesamum calycinum]
SAVEQLQVMASKKQLHSLSLGTGKETEEANYLQQLSDACLLVDALEPSVREDSVKNFCSRELTSYQQIFEGAELAKLDKTERRYAWIKRRLRTNEEIWKIFPPSWHVPYLLCIQFCKLTRTQLEETLSNLNEKPDVGTLLLEQNEHKDLSVPGAGEETWDVEDGSQTNIYLAAFRLDWGFNFGTKELQAQLHFIKSVKYVFERILKAYATKLFGRLPKGGTGIVAAATGMDGQIKTSDRDERLICYIVNTAEYCQKTDEFSAVITKALITLVHGIETKFDTEMVAMTRVPWGTLESVGDQSAYVNGINTILTASIPVLGSLLSAIYFQFFLDKMLLDTQAVKTILLDIPSLGKQKPADAGYSKFVSSEMSKAEALLKVILSPVDSVADTYSALLPEGTPSEFQRILDLKGLKKADQQSILDDYNKRGAGTYQPDIKPVVQAALPYRRTCGSHISWNHSTEGRYRSKAAALALGRGATESETESSKI